MIIIQGLRLYKKLNYFKRLPIYLGAKLIQNVSVRVVEMKNQW